MKVSLVVSEGVHQGKVIPLTGPQFLVGRDPECQLRPASPSVSKKHCLISVREGKVFVKDFGSTNGTFVNGERITGEHEVAAGAKLKIGPLAFTLQIAVPTTKPEAKPAAKTDAKPAGKPAAKPAAAEAETVDLGSSDAEPSISDSARLAAILLGDGAPDSPSEPREEDVPEGSTVFDLPAAMSDTAEQKKPKEAKEESGDNSSAAAEILRQMHRRPRS